VSVAFILRARPGIWNEHPVQRTLILFKQQPRKHVTPNKASVSIAVDPETSVDGLLVSALNLLPGVLLVHGWDSDQTHYQVRAEDIAAFGCVCLTFDLRGHGRQIGLKKSVTREQNLCDVLAAFDSLANHVAVDRQSLALIGTSYGGYLAAIVSSMRNVRWLAMRAPAPYPDDDWDLPKNSLDQEALRRYRSEVRPAGSDRSLAACLQFSGDALIVGSELDETVPATGIASFVRSFQNARSMTYRNIDGADHALSDERSQRAYDALLSAWLTEMILGARRPPSG
jgi:dienelactone hydrolase